MYHIIFIFLALNVNPHPEENVNRLPRKIEGIRSIQKKFNELIDKKEDPNPIIKEKEKNSIEILPNLPDPIQADEYLFQGIYSP